MAVLSASLLLLTSAFLCYIAIHDARNFRVANTSVLVVLGLYVAAQGVLGFPGLLQDLAAGAVLFGMGFAMWLLRTLGAGDAKLMFPLGLHLGMDGLPVFAVLLMVSSVLFYLVLSLCHMAGATRGLAGWFAGLKSGGRLPYAVLLALSAVPVLLLKASLIALP